MTYSRIATAHFDVQVGQRWPSLCGVSGIITSITPMSDGSARVTVQPSDGALINIDVSGIVAAVVQEAA